MKNLTKLTALELGAAIKKGEVSIPEATQAALDAIAARDGELNSFITVTAEQARSRAEALQAGVKEATSPLYGVPMGIKDNICTKGIKTSCASKILGDFQPPYDATIVERLTAAGFDPSVKSFFSWLGVTYYLSAEAIDKTFAELSLLCAEGSTLVFDYPDENFFAACEERVQNTVMMAKAGGEAMQAAFSYGELEKLLETHGFLIYELLTQEEIQRDVIDRAGADLKAFEHVNYCLAVRK